MTPDQITLALALETATMPPGTGTKRFARDMAFRARQPRHADLTPKQAEYLRTAVIRFRRQMPAEVVALAESMAPEQPTSAAA